MRLLKQVLSPALAALTVLAWACPAAPQLSTRDWESGAPVDPEPILLAQAETELRPSILEHLQIELSDLEELTARASQILAGETVRMTLDDVVKAALHSNQDILIISFEPAIAEAALRSAKGDFDPVLRGVASLSESSQPASPQTFFFGGVTSIEERINNYQLTIGGLTPYGTTYELNYGTTRTLGTFTGEMPEYAVGLSLTVTQPLLRGLGKRSNLARVRVARNTYGISESQVKRTVEQTLGEVIKAYWELVGTIGNLRVRRESLANAKRVVEINKQRLEIGTAAAIEVLQAKAKAASRVSDLIVARTQVDNAEDLLKQLIGMQDGGLFSSKHVVPIERPLVRSMDWNLERSMQLALENRAEIRIAKLQIESSEIERKRARMEVLPRIDLQGAYTRNDRNFDFDQALKGIPARHGDIWSIGIQGSIPLGNRTAKGNLRVAQLKVRQNEQRYRKSQQDIMLEVRVALRAAISSEVLAESTRQTRRLEEANVAAEEKRLQLGVTTSQNVLDRQEDLTEAQVAEVRAKVGFERALVDVKVAEGALLEHLGIDFEDAGRR